LKRVILITLFCFFITLKGLAQGYFNKRIDVANKANVTYGMMNINDSLYLASYIFETPIPNLSYSASVLKLDVNGNLLSAKRFKPLNINYTCPGGICYKNNKIYTSGTTDYGLQLQAGLYVFDKKCDTVLTKSFGDTSFYNYAQKIIPYTKTKDKILLIGVTDSTCGSGHQGSYKPFIRVVDTSGTLFQTKLYLSDCKYRNINSVTTTKNKGYLISLGGTYGTWDTETRVLKLDSNLNLVWSKQINLTSSAEPEILNDNDNFYYINSTTIDSVWNFTYKWERACLIKMDTNGTILWQKNYGVKQITLGTTGLKKCINGDFIISGARRTTSNELQGFILRTDSLGNQKWWREYRPNTTPVLDTVAENYLYDIIELPNGDIAAVGWAGQSSISPLQQTWLLKVDSNGCFGAGGCNPNLATSIQEISNENELILNIYPNPFINNITVSYTLSNSNKANVEIKLIELASGRLIGEQTSTKNEDTIKFDTQNLSSGVYLVNVRNNGVSIRNSKVINIK
jgi:hypothetical protein